MLMLGLMTSVLVGFSEQTPTQNHATSKKGDSILIAQSKDLDRKRMPSRNFLEIYYEEGVLSLQSQTLEGEFSMQFSNNETGDFEYVPVISVGECVPIDPDYGSYSVSAVSSTGMELSGEMSVY